LGRGSSAKLKTNVAYEISRVYKSAPEIEVVLELRTDITPQKARYLYSVPCDSLRDGCPEKWPTKFMAVKDGQKLVIVPLTSTAVSEKKS